MPKFKMSWLALPLGVLVLVISLGALTFNHRLSQRKIKANNVIPTSVNATIDLSQTPVKSAQGSVQTAETRQTSKVTFLDAIQIAEATVSGKAYSVEQETEENKPVIEVGIVGKEIFVDAENGEIVLIEDLQQKGDPEDIEEVTQALKLQKLATITIQSALQVGEHFAGRQAHSVNLDNENGGLVYVVGIGLEKVLVDAGNGQILAKRPVEHTDDSDQPPINSSVQVPTSDDEE